ncbi:MAG: radical SAM protein [Bacteroidota bacterium]
MLSPLEKIEQNNFNLDDEEILSLLNIDTKSQDFYRLIYKSNELSRKKFKNRGYVFAQVGINAEPCSVNCNFCSMGIDHYSLDSEWEKDTITLKEELTRLQEFDFNDFFLMVTADYSFDKLIEVSKEIKPLLKPNQRFVANMGDFTFEQAGELKKTGFTGIYHINRLREGTDTRVTTEQREKTIEAVRNAGLELYYCIEPIGPEHSYEEILVEIKRARDLKISVMAVMRRIPVPGTPLFYLGRISASELTKIVAITNIIVNPDRAMNVHEPVQMALLAGVNQLYAELGANPRDTKSDTEKGRGFTPDNAWDLLSEAGYMK